MLLNNNFAFIFDHDGVIADNEQLHEKAWRELFNNHKIKVSNKEFLIKIKGFSTKDGVSNIFSKATSDEKEELCQEKVDIYTKLVLKLLKPVDGVIDFIKNSYNLGIKIAIASAGHRNRIDYSINKFGLANYIDTVLSVEDIAKNKPDPEVYIKTIEKLNLDPKNCYIFEDSVTGLTAANGSGANVIFANTSNIKIDKNIKFDLEIPNFIDIKPNDIMKLL